MLAHFLFWDVFLHHSVGQSNSHLVIPLLSLEVQQPPSGPPHFSLRDDTSLSSLSRRSRRAAKSASQPQDPDPDPKPDGTSLILWVRTREEPAVRSISLPERGTGWIKTGRRLKLNYEISNDEVVRK